jgi:hypothetical protein
LQSLERTNPHWPCVVGYGPFSFRVTHKEGLCPSSGDINGLMMMMTLLININNFLYGSTLKSRQIIGCFISLRLVGFELLYETVDLFMISDLVQQ